MADNVQDATFEILKGIQSSVVDVRDSLRSEIAELRTDMVARFEKVEEGLRNERRNNAGALVMMRATAGHFEQRLRRVEERLDEIQRRSA